uniref:SRCR domain-containing protein n=1 Tax=Ascaris lumbricoides TaxID=6252 RepID=A0A0M3IPZ1_ASCLU
MLPYQQMLNYDDSRPEFRLIDGPSVRQGRLQIRFHNRWRSICTQLTNWTSVDTTIACKSMGYSDGGFWKWYRRNNDTYPFVMPHPECFPDAKSLWDCQGFKESNAIPLSENLCQGEDDIGLYCWGPPIFTGWAKHWKGLQILSSPFIFVPSDPDMVSVHRESLSRLEYVDIFYAGYNAETKNTTAAIWIEGVPPILNGLRIERSARDGVHFYEPSAPIIIANSTIVNNRGHGIAIDNTTDGRVFINMTIVAGNYGDGIRYRQKAGGIQLVRKLIGREQRQASIYYEEKRPRVQMCTEHSIPESLYFPHLISAYLPNGTAIDSEAPSPCWTVIYSLLFFIEERKIIQMFGLPKLTKFTLSLQFH